VRPPAIAIPLPILLFSRVLEHDRLRWASPLPRSVVPNRLIAGRDRIEAARDAGELANT